MSNVPPQSVEAECMVLGAILRDPDAAAIVFDMLAPDDFYRPAHSYVFRSMQTLFTRGREIDAATVADQLEKDGKLAIVGGPTALMDILDSVYGAANVRAHAQIVKDKATLRRMMAIGRKTVERCGAAEGEPSEIIDEIETDFLELVRRDGPDKAVTVSEILPETLAIIEQYKNHSGSQFLPTGFTALDAMIMGLRPSDLLIVAGRPGMGKTALALNIIDSLSTQHQVPCLIFSLEMSKDELTERLICAKARVDSHMLRQGRLRREDYERIHAAAEALRPAPIHIDDSSALNVLEIRSRTRRLQAIHKVGLVAVDYLQLMSAGKSAENRQQEIAVISRSLKSLAKDLKIPVLALSQLSRQVEQRGDGHRPQLSDLRESGAIEQDADVVLFVYRPERYDSNADPHAAEIIVAKQRNGPTGTVPILFLKEFVTFANLNSEDGQSNPHTVPGKPSPARNKSRKDGQS